MGPRYLRSNRSKLASVPARTYSISWASGSNASSVPTSLFNTGPTAESRTKMRLQASDDRFSGQRSAIG